MLYLQVRIDDERLVGGILDHRIALNNKRWTVQENTVLKNDVWVSRDGSGKEWTLVTAGVEINKRMF